MPDPYKRAAAWIAAANDALGPDLRVPNRVWTEGREWTPSYHGDAATLRRVSILERYWHRPDLAADFIRRTPNLAAAARMAAAGYRADTSRMAAAIAALRLRP